MANRAYHNTQQRLTTHDASTHNSPSKIVWKQYTLCGKRTLSLDDLLVASSITGI